MEINFSQKRKIEEVAEKYHIGLMILFGSRAKKQLRHFHQEADFDIAYLSKSERSEGEDEAYASSPKDLSGKEIIDLDCDLMDVFSSDRIDLMDLRKANPFLRYEIARNSQLLFGEEIDYLNFKSFAFKDYINHETLFDLSSVLIRRKHELLRKKIYGK